MINKCGTAEPSVSLTALTSPKLNKMPLTPIIQAKKHLHNTAAALKALKISHLFIRPLRNVEC